MQRPVIHDPSCGGAEFLRACGPASLAALISHATPGPEAEPADAAQLQPCPLIQRDSLSAETRDDERRFPVIVTNPPFGGATGSESDARGDKNTAKTELLFLYNAIEKLPAGGRACLLVPPGLLYGSGKAQVQLRRLLMEVHRLEAVISLPGGVFKPHSGIATALVIFRKGLGPTDKVWLANVRAVGYSLDGKRRPVEENDLPSVLDLWRTRHARAENDRASQAFFVDAAEIRGQEGEREYNLSFNRYQEFNVEREEIPPLDELMRDILRLGRDADRHMVGLAAITGLDLGDLVKEGLVCPNCQLPADDELPSLRLVRPSDGLSGMEYPAGDDRQPPPLDLLTTVAAAGSSAPATLKVRQDERGLWLSVLDTEGIAYAAVQLDLGDNRLTLRAWNLEALAAGSDPAATTVLADHTAAPATSA